MKPLHLGTRITLWSALVVTFTILLCGAAATLFVHHEETKELDNDLTSESGLFLGEWKNHGGPAFDWIAEKAEAYDWPPSGDLTRLLEVTNGRGETIFRSKALGTRSLPSLPPGVSTIEWNGITARMLVRREEGLTLRLASDVAPINELTGELAAACLLVLPVALVSVFFGSRWIARQALAPIRRITESAEQVSARRLDQRVPVPPAQDEIHRLATVLNAAFDRLDNSFHQATRFTADASHELKTPLTLMRTGVEALLHSPTLNAVDQVAVEELLEETKRLSSITGNLLLLSRADAGKLTLDLRPDDLSAIVAMCVDDARILSESRAITISARLPGTAAAHIDRTRAAQIVMNLLDNAVKYNHAGGSIHVSLASTDDTWKLTVENTGPGIPEDAVPNLFTRFFRAEHTAAIVGHGLGLSLSRELARAHEGDIVHVPGEPGLTCFIATFPVAGGGGEE